MSYPKIKPCPNCGGECDVYVYDNGTRHVECDHCGYLGPGAGSIRAAIALHHAKMAALQPAPELILNDAGPVGDEGGGGE